jgi:hypothetical protein
MTGNVPLTPQGRSVRSLEDIRSRADRPIVVFPECTTSNGRGLLRFAEVFKEYSVPTKHFSVFVMCVRSVIYSILHFPSCFDNHLQ